MPLPTGSSGCWRSKTSFCATTLRTSTHWNSRLASSVSSSATARSPLPRASVASTAYPATKSKRRSWHRRSRCALVASLIQRQWPTPILKPLWSPTSFSSERACLTSSTIQWPWTKRSAIWSSSLDPRSKFDPSLLFPVSLARRWRWTKHFSLTLFYVYRCSSSSHPTDPHQPRTFASHGVRRWVVGRLRHHRQPAVPHVSIAI